MEKSTVFETRGNVELLSQLKVALFASKETPKTLYADALALFQSLQNMPLALAGGWHAPLEKFLFKNILLRCQANFIQYLARDINRIKPGAGQAELLKNEKLLLISPDIRQVRPSESLVKKRDSLLFSQISKILFLHISPGGRLEKYFNQLNPAEYHLYILDHPLNKPFFRQDVLRINAENAEDILS